MHRLRSPGTVGQWTAVLSVLLVVGPLVQSMAPCGGAGTLDASASETMEATVTPGVQWACAEAAVAAMVRAVSSEPSAFGRGGPLGEGTAGTREVHSLSTPLKAWRHALRLPRSPTLDRLRPVVLQI